MNNEILQKFPLTNLKSLNSRGLLKFITYMHETEYNRQWFISKQISFP